jgi:hypothetical protein
MDTSGRIAANQDLHNRTVLPAGEAPKAFDSDAGTTLIEAGELRQAET